MFYLNYWKNRVTENREFFNCDIEIIKNTISKIEKLFQESTIEQIIDTYIFDPLKINIDNKIKKYSKRKYSERKFNKKYNSEDRLLQKDSRNIKDT